MSRHITSIPGRKNASLPALKPLFISFVIGVLRAISWRICRKHMRFAVSWPSLVSNQCLHAYAAMYCPTPCSLRLCGSCTELNCDIHYCCRSERSLFFFAKKKHCIFCFVFARNRIFNDVVRRFSKSGDFSIVSPVFCYQGCLSRG